MSSKHLDQLRRRAQQVIDRKADDFAALAPDQLDAELRAVREYMEELERSHEHLARTNRELETSNSRFSNQRDFLETTLDSIGDAVIATNTDGVVWAINPVAARMTGWSAAEAEGKPLTEILIIQDAITGKPVENPAIRAMKAGVVVGMANHTRLISRSGEEYQIADSAAPIRKADGTTLGSVLVFRDITDEYTVREKLKLSEERFRTAFKTSPDAVNLNRLSDGLFLEINDGFTQLMGYTREDVRGKTSLELNIWEDPADRERLVKGLRQYGVVKNLEAKFNNKTGESHSGLMSARVVELGGEQVILSITRDITERHEIEAQLKDSETRLRSVIESSPLGMHFYSLLEGDQLVFTGGNPAADTILGVDNSAFIGKTIEKAFPQLIDTEVPERYKDAAGKGTPWNTEQIEYNEGGIAGAFEVNAFQVDPGRMVAMFHDITVRKQAEEALRISEERNRSINAALPDMLFELDEQGTFIHAQAPDPSMLKVPFTEFLGKRIADVFDDEFVELTMKNVRRTLDTGEVQEYSYSMRMGDETHQYEARMVPKGDTHALAIVRDVTEFVRREEKLHHVEQQLLQSQKIEYIGLLAGGVAHDLNNLLTPILVNADFLSEDLKQSDLLEYVDGINEAANSAKDLVQQLLAFSRKQMLNVRPMHVNELLQRFQPLLQRTLRDDIDVVLDLAAAEDTVSADINQMEQIVMNLAINAQDAMPDGGTFRVSSRTVNISSQKLAEATELAEGEYIQLEFSDTGVGMGEEILARVFDPFFTTKEKGKGTGLGLSTVHGIVKQHGGDIRVQSQVGKGTTFSLYLQLSRKSRSDHVKRAAEIVETPSSQGTILIAEDDEQIRVLLGKILQNAGFNILVLDTPEDAVELTRTYDGPIELLISDVVMPAVNGKDLYNQLLQIVPDLKVIFISGYSDDVITYRGVLLEGINFLQKPFTRAQLLAKIQHVLHDED